MMDTEQVVLLDEEGQAIGTAPKSSVHGTQTRTPSCILVPCHE